MEKSLDKWYWADSGKKIGFPLKFDIGQPDSNGTNEFCLAMQMSNKTEFSFHDVPCTTEIEFKFACHRLA